MAQGAGQKAKGGNRISDIIDLKNIVKWSKAQGAELRAKKRV
jgi:hypothetical protein